MKASLFFVACLTAHSALGITAEGKLEAETKRALREMKIGAAEVQDADAHRPGLARSVRQFVLLLRLQAADEPSRGPLPAPEDLDAIHRMTKDKVKNPGLPKLALSDLPPELTRALLAAKLVDDSKGEVTPAHLVTWLLNRHVMLELQAQLEKSRSSARAFWRKLDASSERLILAYRAGLKRSPVVSSTYTGRSS